MFRRLATTERQIYLSIAVDTPVSTYYMDTEKSEQLKTPRKQMSPFTFVPKEADTYTRSC